MLDQINLDQLPEILRDTIVTMVRQDGPDLTARQLAVFLRVYLLEGPHTVRGLADALNVAKPAISRALDRLDALKFAERVVDPSDRRSLLVRRTRKGVDLLRELRASMAQIERERRNLGG